MFLPCLGFCLVFFFLSRSSDNTLVPIFLSNKNVLTHRVAQAQVTKFLLEFHGKTKQNIKQPYTRVRGEKRRGRAGEEEEERREERREKRGKLFSLVFEAVSHALLTGGRGDEACIVFAR